MPKQFNWMSVEHMLFNRLHGGGGPPQRYRQVGTGEFLEENLWGLLVGGLQPSRSFSKKRVCTAYIRELDLTDALINTHNLVGDLWRMQVARNILKYHYDSIPSEEYVQALRYAAGTRNNPGPRGRRAEDLSEPRYSEAIYLFEEQTDQEDTDWPEEEEFEEEEIF